MSQFKLSVNISHFLTQKLSREYDNQNNRKQTQLNWKNLTWWVLFAASSAIGSLEHSVAVAAELNPDFEQGKPYITELYLSQETSHTEIAQSPLPTSQSPPQKEAAESPQTDGDPELGILRVQEQELQAPPYKSIGYVLGQVGYFQSNNIFAGIDPVDDGLFSSGLTFAIAPKLGKKTSLVTAIDGRLTRYTDHTNANYNQLSLRAGLRRQLTPQMFGEIGWNNQQLFSAKTGDRFLNEHALRLALQRQDKITDKLWLTSLYEFRLGFADPDTRSRAINSLSTDLIYYIQPRLQLALGYQFALSDFTQREREDTYHLILGSLTYETSRTSQINIEGGVSFGGSSDPSIDFNNLFFSVSYTVELGKF